MVLFLHLSDIHFHKESGEPYDIDEDLRVELRRDACRFAVDHGPPDAILICGDVAYSGQPTEYEHAKSWLDSLATDVQRDPSFIWCVPGNHDVDQAKIRRSQILQDIQEKLRTVDPARIDALIARYMFDPNGNSLLFDSIAEYNRFARLYECEICPDQPMWTQSFPLSDGSELRVNGLNSTTVSNHLDNQVRKIVLGRYQLPRRADGVVDVALCHHPPDWWHDDDDVQVEMAAKCRVELFGHKHIQRMNKLDETLIVTAGAVHPERNDVRWEPRYNWIKLDVRTENGARKLVVDVFPRLWSVADASFIPDSNSCSGNENKEFEFKLEAWSGPPRSNSRAEAASDAGESVSEAEVFPVNRGRILTYRFFELPHVTRLAIAQALSLLQDEDEGVEDTVLFRSILRRARERNLLGKLWDQVQTNHGDGLYTENPYRTED